uniref:C2H2-type domain-containing protein n=1 Tax=Anopheles atroparvus TaxID=41427 RepID=A0A182J994_ANOAO
MICGHCSTKLKTIEADVKLFQESDRKLRASMFVELGVVDGTSMSKNVAESNMENHWDSHIIVCANLQDSSETLRHISGETQMDPIKEGTDERLVDKPTTDGHNTGTETNKIIPIRRSQRVRKKHESLVSPSSGSSTTDGESDGGFDPFEENGDQTFQPETEQVEMGATAKEKEKVLRKTASYKQQKKRKGAAKMEEQGKSRKPENVPLLHDFKCYICNSQPLGSRKALIEHLASHVDKIPYTCEKCVMETVVLTRVRTLNTHMKMHEQPVKCDYCDRRYSNAAGKYYHTQTYHLGGGAPCLVDCDICGKQCGSKMALKQHMKYHTTSLKCSKCDMVFNHANKRRNHELTHDEQRGYECIVCKKVLQTIESYDVHLKKHSQERSYQCSLCPKKFNTSFNLILHLKVHAKNYNYRPAKSWVEHYTILSRDPMQYKCNHCDRYGTDKVNNMISHLQAHFKEYQCDRCKRLFATAKQLRAHLTTYTGEKPEIFPRTGERLEVLGMDELGLADLGSVVVVGLADFGVTVGVFATGGFLTTKVPPPKLGFAPGIYGFFGGTERTDGVGAVDLAGDVGLLK